MTDRFELQNAQYQFPYHYLPHLEDGHARRGRSLRWGREYLCYLMLLAEKVRALAPRSLLDVGCGDGRLLSLLAPDIPACQGVDLSEAAIRFARAFVPAASFAVEDAADLSGSFDVVTAIEVLEHVPDDGVIGFLQTLGARCRAGGTVILSVPSVNVPLNKKHFRHYDRDLLARQLADAQVAWRLENVEYVYRQPSWLTAMDRLIDNKYFRLEVSALERALWQHTWNRLRHAGPDNGRHLVATLRRAG